jgi:hypothetical protein
LPGRSTFALRMCLRLPHLPLRQFLLVYGI